MEYAWILIIVIFVENYSLALLGLDCAAFQLGQSDPLLLPYLVSKLISVSKSGEDRRRLIRFGKVARSQEVFFALSTGDGPGLTGDLLKGRSRESNLLIVVNIHFVTRSITLGSLNHCCYTGVWEEGKIILIGRAFNRI
jgi:hypothetical protein